MRIPNTSSLHYLKPTRDWASLPNAFAKYRKFLDEINNIEVEVINFVWHRTTSAYGFRVKTVFVELYFITGFFSVVTSLKLNLLQIVMC